MNTSQNNSWGGRLFYLVKLNLLFCIFVFFFISGCSNQSKNTILFDFENDSELDLFNWKCGSLFKISDEYKKNGENSLRMEFYPSEQIGFSCGRLKDSNWSKYAFFDFTVYNPSDRKQTLFIRISDSNTDGKRIKAYEREIVFTPGEKTISIPLKDLYDSNGRKMNLNKILGFYIYSKNKNSKEIFYFDYFRLYNLIK